MSFVHVLQSCLNWFAKKAIEDALLASATNVTNATMTLN
jgi:hypothetical protein